MNQELNNELDDEFIDKITAPFFEILHEEDVEKVKEEFHAIHNRKHDPLILELMLAKSQVDLKTTFQHWEQFISSNEQVDLLMIEATKLEHDGTDKILEHLIQKVEKLTQKPKDIARKGGLGRAAKYDRLKEETIRLYENQTWKNAATAALAITPQIVEMSRNGNGDLAPTTSKPLAWIREYIRMKTTSS